MVLLRFQAACLVSIFIHERPITRIIFLSLKPCLSEVYLQSSIKDYPIYGILAVPGRRHRRLVTNSLA